MRTEGGKIIIDVPKRTLTLEEIILSKQKPLPRSEGLRQAPLPDARRPRFSNFQSPTEEYKKANPLPMIICAGLLGCTLFMMDATLTRSHASPAPQLKFAAETSFMEAQSHPACHIVLAGETSKETLERNGVQPSDPVVIFDYQTGTKIPFAPAPTEQEEREFEKFGANSIVCLNW